MVKFCLISLFSLHFVCSALSQPASAQQNGNSLQKILVDSSLDQTPQPSLLWIPPENNKPQPLLVFLHSWSGNYMQDNRKWHQEAVDRNWIYLQPNFRGANDDPQAGGSALARQDVLDAIDFVSSRLNVDTTRIYLAGSSGGGHMAMLMAGYFPERFSAVSAWVGISDLATWADFHSRTGKPQRYAQMIHACTGGPPRSSEAIQQEYRSRSPIYHLQNASELPLDLNAGVHDGHTGSVPIHHTLNAFNVLAKANDTPQISPTEIFQLWTQQKLTRPEEPDLEHDLQYDREIHLHRTSHQTRVTIFEGGHESLPEPACNWLSEHVRETAPK